MMAKLKDTQENFLTFNYIFGLDQLHVVRLMLAWTHAVAAWYFWLDFYMGAVPFGPIIFELIYGLIGGLGLTIGSHRYWTHRSFKATLPLQIFLMICQTISMQLPIRKWCLDHRLHHKYTDTNKDPHNSTRGFWFSHIGWLILPKHPELVAELERFEVPDLDNDPVVRFQSKWYTLLTNVFQLLVPMMITKCLWPQMTYWQCYGSTCRRYVASLHITFTVNSFAHLYGSKPYDGRISATENPFVSYIAFGEGWHNFHHAFPWDYKASEFGWKLNGSTMVIDFFAWIGWAYDLKTVSSPTIEKRRVRTGNKSTALKDQINCEKRKTSDEIFDSINPSEHAVWGWDDETLSEELKKVTMVSCPKF